MQISYPNKLPYFGLYGATLYACEKLKPDLAICEYRVVFWNVRFSRGWNARFEVKRLFSVISGSFQVISGRFRLF